MTLIGGVAVPGRGKREDDVSWTDMNFTGLKNEKKINAIDLTDTNGQ
jgi:hypothetical protein